MTVEVSIDQLKQNVEAAHGGRATFVQSVTLHEQHGGQALWDGIVTVFDLKGSPTGAFRAYACSDTRANGEERCLIILHSHVVVGPRQAVRAALMAEQAFTA